MLLSAVRSAVSSAVQSMIGTGLKPTFNLVFAGATALDQRVTFSRTSNATLIGSDGTLQYAPHNLLTYSEQFDNAAWSKFQATISANTTTAPDGATTADSLIESVGAGTHVTFQNVTTSAAASQTISIYAKANQRSRLQIFVSDTGANAISGIFNLSTGTVVSATNAGTGTDATATITPVGADWYRCVLTGIPATSGATVRVHFYLMDNTNNQSYTGDGTSGIYTWGAQLNVGALQPYYSTTVKNLLGYSQEFDNAAWTKSNSTITANVTAAPDGSVTADKLVEDTVNAAHFVQSANLTAQSGTAYTFSCYAKAAERSKFELLAFALTLTGRGFDLSNGTTFTNTAGLSEPTASSITPVGNGWYRCSITANGNGLLSSVRAYLNNGTTYAYTGDGTSGIFIWGAQFSDSASLDPYVYNPAAAPSNTAYYGPRFDYDPVTLAAKGLLIEEQRTNSIRNNTMQGAVAGTPGTAPTTWSLISGGGLSREVVSIGTESGISYIDVRFFGTPSSIAAQRVYVESSFTISAADGQAWSLSAYVKLVAGTAPSGLFIGFDETGPGATYIKTDQANLPLTSTLTRAKYSATLSGGVNVAYVIPQIGFNSEIGVAVDFTLRIGLPQLELGAFATSVIPTTTAAATRAADSASVTATNFSNWFNPVEGTIFAEFGPYGNGGPTKNFGVVHMDDGTSSNIIRMFAGSTVSPVFAVTASTVTQAYLSSEVIASTNISKIAGAYQTNNFARSVNGTPTTTDSLGTVPVVNRMLIASGTIGVGELNGHIRSLKYYPRRLSGAKLQSITA